MEQIRYGNSFVFLISLNRRIVSVLLYFFGIQCFILICSSNFIENKV